MVNPYILGSVQRQQIFTVAVVSARTFESDIAEDDVTASEIYDTGFALCLTCGDKSYARQRHNGYVIGVGAYLILKGQVLCNDDDFIAL